MSCLLTLTITLYGHSTKIEKEYVGHLVAIQDKHYLVDFMVDLPGLGPVSVPKRLCVKAE